MNLNNIRLTKLAISSAIVVIAFSAGARERHDHQYESSHRDRYAQDDRETSGLTETQQRALDDCRLLSSNEQRRCRATAKSTSRVANDNDLSAMHLRSINGTTSFADHKRGSDMRNRSIPSLAPAHALENPSRLAAISSVGRRAL